MGNTVSEDTCAKVKFENISFGSPTLTILIDNKIIVDKLGFGKATEYLNIPIEGNKTNIKIKWGHILQMNREIELIKSKTYEVKVDENYLKNTSIEQQWKLTIKEISEVIL